MKKPNDVPAIAASLGSEDTVDKMEVNGALLPYAAEGQGPTVVFLHGALTDYRMWNRHRSAIADRYRAVSYTQRYFGPLPWEEDWPPFGVHTHSADLLEFLRKLGAGPVHLVAWSYSGHIALNVALQHPEMLNSVFIYEPGVPTWVSDPAELEAFVADANLMFGPIFEAVQGQGDHLEGVRRLLDGSGRKHGYFDAQPQEQKNIQIDNARTLPLQLSQAEPPMITCEQLAGLTLPVCIAQGELTRPLFSVVSHAAARCIPACRRLIIPGATHMWPAEDPLGFTAGVVNFLEGQQP